MICLSKADEGAFRHLSFNQSPGPLAAENTTRQDMNGISNLREHVASGQDEDSGGGNLLGSADTDEKWNQQCLPPGPDGPRFAGAGRWFCGPSSHLKTATGGDDQPCSLSVSSPACRSRLWGWITWTASVILVSTILTTVLNVFNGSGRGINNTSPIVSEPSVSSSEIPTQPPVHLVQNIRKRSSCASGGVDADLYNTPLHVGALLIIWFVSTLSCAFALFAKKFPGLHIPQRFFFIVRHFGTGVLIATAFVHLLPTAFISLNDPCLGKFWNEDYPAMPGAIALAAIFFVIVIEMVFHPARRCTATPDALERENAVEILQENATARHADSLVVPMRDMAPPRARSSSTSQGLNRIPTAVTIELARRQREVENQAKMGSDESVIDRTPSLELSESQKLRKERLQCVLLELGILFHSVFIGMALSVSIGNDFVVLLIAIIFHQTFEGLALGSRISMVKWPESNKYQPWLMALAYGCTTPLGQAIGIATHTLYSPDSQVGLIVVGVMNSISAGLLTYASLVELMAEDFLSDESWKYLRGRKRIMACFLVFLGAFGMSLVGAWA